MIKFPFTTLYVNRDLLWQFTVRNVELRNKGSHLGLAWSILNPLLMVSLYVLVFGYIFGGRFGVQPNETPMDYGLGIFLGLAFFNFFGDVIGTACGVISDNPNFVKKVVFPLEILPAAMVGASFVHMVITLVLVGLGLVFFGQGFGWSALYFLLILPPVVMAALGIAWFLASISVFLLDLKQIVPALITALMFSSAVFYDTSRIPQSAWVLLRFNPLLHAISLARSVVLWQRSPDLGVVLFLYASGLLVMVIGFASFQKLKPAFADVL